jgi:hypothetical protein
MRFVRPLTAMDDLIGGLAAQTRSELLTPRDLLDLETVQARVIRSSANALAQELRRPGCDLPNFISRRTNWTSRQERNLYENFWAVHLSEGALRNCLPLDGDVNWPRALGYAQEIIVCGVLAELREEGLI